VTIRGFGRIRGEERRPRAQSRLDSFEAGS